MACQTIRSWTLSRLIEAFIDLGVAYVLLCCSTVAFFISRFLGFFGFSLPCPCSGLFSEPNPDQCLQKLLVHTPTNKISTVQLSIRSKFPFDSVWDRNDDCQLSFKVVREKKLESGVIELEGEASCSSVSVARKSPSAALIDSHWKNEGLADAREGRLDVKGKGVAHRQRGNLRRRCRSSADHIKLSPNSSYDNVQSGAPVVPLSKYGNGNSGNEIIAENSTTIDSHDVMESPNVMELGHKSWHSSESIDVIDANNFVDKDIVPLGGEKSGTGQHLNHDGHLENAIRVLEQALEEERAARAALLFDLEKERIAASTAADEAMAMILRLQEEKAAIELEARQYERILEEKSTYDAEEMDILKEIIVRREREKHFLEKEVESYRNMLQENELVEGDADNVPDLQDENNTSLLVPDEVERLIVQQPSESTGTAAIMQSNSNFQSISAANALELTQCHNIPETVGLDDNRYYSVGQVDLHSTVEFSQEFQEKGMLSVASPKGDKSSQSDGPRHHEESMVLTGEAKNDRRTELNEQDDCKGPGLQGGNLNVKEQNLHDVHIIDVKCVLQGNESNERAKSPNDVGKYEFPSKAVEVQKVDEFSCCATSSSYEMEQENNSIPEIVSTLPPLSSSNCKSKASVLRRNSISAVDNERQKIDNEVGYLRQRLRSIQAGRKKLNFSFEHRDKGETQLLLLEDLANLLQDIRQLTEPQKTMRRTSLPPPGSKVTSKKKRCRSASVGVYQSS